MMQSRDRTGGDMPTVANVPVLEIVAKSEARLGKLADFLADLSADRFDYGHWVGTDWQGAPDLSCGTSACAVGWAAVIPEFQTLGLELVPERTPGAFTPSFHINGEPHDALNAACLVFGLYQAEAQFLFLPESPAPWWWEEEDLGSSLPERAPRDDATPGRVADHIRHFVSVRRSHLAAAQTEGLGPLVAL